MNKEDKIKKITEYTRLINEARLAVIRFNNYFSTEMELVDFKDIGDTDEAKTLISTADGFDNTCRKLLFNN